MKAGLIAVPFIVTLAARPVRAQDTMTGSLGTYTAYNDTGGDEMQIGPTPPGDRQRIRRS